MGERGFRGERIAWLDLLKVVSAFAVVMTHIASIGWQAMPPSAPGWFATSVYEIVTRFAVPCFFMTSGALLLDPERRVDGHRAIMRGALSFAAIALGLSLVFCFAQDVLAGWQGWRQVVVAAIDGPYFIWYLWVMTGVYLLLPALRQIAADQGVLRATLAVLAVFVIGRSTVAAMAPGSLLDVWFGNFILFTPGMGGVFYFLLGRYLLDTPMKPSRSAACVAAGVIAVSVAIGLNYLDALAEGPDLYYVARDNALIAVYSVGVFQLVRTLGETLPAGGFVQRLSRLGLYVYLAHPFLRLIMEGVDAFSGAVSWLMLEPVIAVPVVSLVVWAASIALSWTWTSVVARVRSALCHG